MISLEHLRENPELYRSSITNRGSQTNLVDSLLQADEEYRETLNKADALRAERNQLTKTKDSAQANKERLGLLKTELNDLEEQEKKLATHRHQLLVQIPNTISPDVPIGPGESANTVIETKGQIRIHEGKSHEELMAKLGWIDLNAAAKVSGSRFRYLKNKAALAHMKLMLQAIEFAVENGFEPVIPPIMLRAQILEQAGWLPSGQEDTFKIEGTDLYLSGTSEFSLVGQAADTVWQESELPKRYVGFSSCFRKEAGSYGKDVQGMFRQHQFDKVEMVSITTPEQSAQEHEFLLKMQKDFVDQFDLPYQVVLIGSGDLGASASKKYDINTWFPSQQRYRETHSTSNCTDYQARGLDIKYRKADGKTGYAHTLNGTLAVERLLLAIIENNQTDDHGVTLPESLTK